jgi:hypothetical protein
MKNTIGQKEPVHDNQPELMLSPEAIKSFQNIYKLKFGVGLTDQQADAYGIQLLNFMKLVYRPVKKKEYEDEKNDKRGNKKTISPKD